MSVGFRQRRLIFSTKYNIIKKIEASDDSLLYSLFQYDLYCKRNFVFIDKICSEREMLHGPPKHYCGPTNC